jgi:cell division protein FtsI/penicillin-binding protein 2
MVRVRSRLRVLAILCVVPFAVVLGRLAHLQVFEGAAYRQLAGAMGRTLHVNPPLRGRILCANGAVLADNEVCFDLVFTVDGLLARERILSHLEKVLGLCTEPAHGARFEMCDCGAVEARLLELAGEAEQIELAVLRGEPPPRFPLVERIPPAVHGRFSRHFLHTLAENGITFESDAARTAYTAVVDPVRLLRMELALLRLSRLCGIPYGFPNPELQHTLRGRVAAAVADVREPRGGADVVERKQVRQERDRRRALERLLVADVSKEAITEVEYESELYAGIHVTRRHRRSYPLGEAAGIVSGFTREASRDDIDRWKQSGLLVDPGGFEPEEFLQRFPELRREGRFSDDIVGASGIERSLDDRLRGRHGLQLLVVDARGRALPQQQFVPVHPVPGEEVLTTLDASLQQLLHGELAAACGDHGHARAGSAVVLALRAESGARGGFPGAVLAMASAPTFDPNRVRSSEYMAKLTGDTNARPLFNRALAPPRFPPPGSVFKLIVAIAAMESGVRENSPSPLRPDETYECTYIFDERHRNFYRCNARAGHGLIALEEALKVSCNCYFYWLARDRLKPGDLAHWARNFGFGRPTGIDLPLSPSMQRGELQTEAPWSEMPSYGIGDRFVEASPLQVARAVGAIALGGRVLPRPYLVEAAPPESIEIRFNHTIRVVRAGMRRAIAEPGGTAAREELTRFDAAVKTGTAQISRDREEYFAWVAGFAPFDRPEIAFAICLEHTPLHGGEATAPILEKLLGFFAGRRPGRYLREEGP